MIVTKRAEEQSNYHRSVYFYRSAREGFRDFLANLRAPVRSSVLLPSFIGWSPKEGSGVFDPVNELSLPVDFYALNRDLTADVGDIARRLESGRYRALVIIHYFGRTDPNVELIRDLARRYAVPLVEDLAHGLFSAAKGGVAGSFGDVALYSLHKMLPVPAGGMAVYSDEELIRGQRTTAPELADSILSFNWHSISAARRTNFSHMAEAMKEYHRDFQGVELPWPRLADTDVPQTLPLYLLQDDRDLLYKRMNAAGFGVVSLYHTLIPQVSDAFPLSMWASRHILNLPVHQDATPQSLDLLICGLRQSLTDGGCSDR